jgi:LexA-binding, inner membrane-associated putative hydrolase
MFLGHFAVAYAAKAAEPKTSLATCFVAAQLPDIVWPWLVLAGVERVSIVPGDTPFTPLRFESYPFSHSLVMVTLWAVLFAALHFWRERRLRAALLLGALVLSHWLLDFATHRPDIPVLPDNRLLVGLGLWNSVPATVIVEGLMYAVGLVLYFRTGPRPVRAGVLAVVLAALYVANILGPPPPDVTAMAAVTAIGGVLFAAWAAWADRRPGPLAA